MPLADVNLPDTSWDKKHKSITATFELPRYAAKRLHDLAISGDRRLKEIGILKVQIRELTEEWGRRRQISDVTKGAHPQRNKPLSPDPSVATLNTGEQFPWQHQQPNLHFTYYTSSQPTQQLVRDRADVRLYSLPTNDRGERQTKIIGISRGVLTDESIPVDRRSQESVPSWLIENSLCISFRRHGKCDVACQTGSERILYRPRPGTFRYEPSMQPGSTTSGVLMDKNGRYKVYSNKDSTNFQLNSEKAQSRKVAVNKGQCSSESIRILESLANSLVTAEEGTGEALSGAYPISKKPQEEVIPGQAVIPRPYSKANSHRDNSGTVSSAQNQSYQRPIEHPKSLQSGVKRGPKSHEALYKQPSFASQSEIVLSHEVSVEGGRNGKTGEESYGRRLGKENGFMRQESMKYGKRATQGTITAGNQNLERRLSSDRIFVQADSKEKHGSAGGFVQEKSVKESSVVLGIVEKAERLQDRFVGREVKQKEEQRRRLVGQLEANHGNVIETQMATQVVERQHDVEKSRMLIESEAKKSNKKEAVREKKGTETESNKAVGELETSHGSVIETQVATQVVERRRDVENSRILIESEARKSNKKEAVREKKGTEIESNKAVGASNQSIFTPTDNSGNVVSSFVGQSLPISVVLDSDYLRGISARGSDGRYRRPVVKDEPFGKGDIYQEAGASEGTSAAIRINRKRGRLSRSDGVLEQVLPEEAGRRKRGKHTKGKNDVVSVIGLPKEELGADMVLQAMGSKDSPKLLVPQEFKSKMADRKEVIRLPEAVGNESGMITGSSGRDRLKKRALESCADHGKFVSGSVIPKEEVRLREGMTAGGREEVHVDQGQVDLAECASSTENTSRNVKDKVKTSSKGNSKRRPSTPNESGTLPTPIPAVSALPLRRQKSLTASRPSSPFESDIKVRSRSHNWYQKDTIHREIEELYLRSSPSVACETDQPLPDDIYYGENFPIVFVDDNEISMKFVDMSTAFKIAMKDKPGASYSSRDEKRDNNAAHVPKVKPQQDVSKKNVNVNEKVLRKRASAEKIDTKISQSKRRSIDNNNDVEFVADRNSRHSTEEDEEEEDAKPSHRMSLRPRRTKAIEDEYLSTDSLEEDDTTEPDTGSMYDSDESSDSEPLINIVKNAGKARETFTKQLVAIPGQSVGSGDDEDAGRKPLQVTGAATVTSVQLKRSESVSTHDSDTFDVILPRKKNPPEARPVNRSSVNTSEVNTEAKMTNTCNSPLEATKGPMQLQLDAKDGQAELNRDTPWKDDALNSIDSLQFKSSSEKQTMSSVQKECQSDLDVEAVDGVANSEAEDKLDGTVQEDFEFDASSEKEATSENEELPLSKSLREIKGKNGAKEKVKSASIINEKGNEGQIKQEGLIEKGMDSIKNHVAAKSGHVLSKSGNTLSDSVPAALQSGNMLPEGGHVVPESGNVLPEAEQALLESLHVFSKSVHALPEGDHTLSENEHMVPESGNAVPRSQHELPENENIVPLESEHVLSEGGHLVLEGERLFSESDHVLPEREHVFSESDHVLPQSGHVSSEIGDIISQSGHVLPQSGDMISNSDHVVSESRTVVFASDHINVEKEDRDMAKKAEKSLSKMENESAESKIVIAEKGNIFVKLGDVLQKDAHVTCEQKDTNEAKASERNNEIENTIENNGNEIKRLINATLIDEEKDIENCQSLSTAIQSVEKSTEKSFEVADSSPNENASVGESSKESSRITRLIKRSIQRVSTTLEKSKEKLTLEKQEAGKNLTAKRDDKKCATEESKADQDNIDVVQSYDEKSGEKGTLPRSVQLVSGMTSSMDLDVDDVSKDEGEAGETGQGNRQVSCVEGEAIHVADTVVVRTEETKSKAFLMDTVKVAVEKLDLSANKGVLVDLTLKKELSLAESVEIDKGCVELENCDDDDDDNNASRDDDNDEDEEVEKVGNGDDDINNSTGSHVFIGSEAQASVNITGVKLLRVGDIDDIKTSKGVSEGLAANGDAVDKETIAQITECSDEDNTSCSENQSKSATGIKQSVSQESSLGPLPLKSDLGMVGDTDCFKGSSGLPVENNSKPLAEGNVSSAVVMDKESDTDTLKDAIANLNFDSHNSTGGLGEQPNFAEKSNSFTVDGVDKSEKSGLSDEERSAVPSNVLDEFPVDSGDTRVGQCDELVKEAAMEEEYDAPAMPVQIEPEYSLIMIATEEDGDSDAVLGSTSIMSRSSPVAKDGSMSKDCDILCDNDIEGSEKSLCKDAEKESGERKSSFTEGVTDVKEGGHGTVINTTGEKDSEKLPDKVKEEEKVLSSEDVRVFKENDFKMGDIGGSSKELAYEKEGNEWEEGELIKFSSHSNEDFGKYDVSVEADCTKLREGLIAASRDCLDVSDRADQGKGIDGEKVIEREEEVKAKGIGACKDEGSKIKTGGVRGGEEDVEREDANKEDSKNELVKGEEVKKGEVEKEEVADGNVKKEEAKKVEVKKEEVKKDNFINEDVNGEEMINENLTSKKDTMTGDSGGAENRNNISEGKVEEIRTEENDSGSDKIQNELEPVTLEETDKVNDVEKSICEEQSDNRCKVEKLEIDKETDKHEDRNCERHEEDNGKKSVEQQGEVAGEQSENSDKGNKEANGRKKVVRDEEDLDDVSYGDDIAVGKGRGKDLNGNDEPGPDGVKVPVKEIIFASGDVGGTPFSEETSREDVKSNIVEPESSYQTVGGNTELNLISEKLEAKMGLVVQESDASDSVSCDKATIDTSWSTGGASKRQKLDEESPTSVSKTVKLDVTERISCAPSQRIELSSDQKVSPCLGYSEGRENGGGEKTEEDWDRGKFLTATTSDCVSIDLKTRDVTETKLATEVEAGVQPTSMEAEIDLKSKLCDDIVDKSMFSGDERCKGTEDNAPHLNTDQEFSVENYGETLQKDKEQCENERSESYTVKPDDVMTGIEEDTRKKPDESTNGKEEKVMEGSDHKGQFELTDALQRIQQYEEWSDDGSIGSMSIDGEACESRIGAENLDGHVGESHTTDDTKCDSNVEPVIEQVEESVKQLAGGSSREGSGDYVTNAGQIGPIGESHKTLDANDRKCGSNVEYVIERVEGSIKQLADSFTSENSSDCVKGTESRAGPIGESHTTLDANGKSGDGNVESVIEQVEGSVKNLADGSLMENSGDCVKGADSQTRPIGESHTTQGVDRRKFGSNVESVIEQVEGSIKQLTGGNSKEGSTNCVKGAESRIGPIRESHAIQHADRFAGGFSREGSSFVGRIRRYSTTETDVKQRIDRPKRRKSATDTDVIDDSHVVLTRRMSRETGSPAKRLRSSKP